MKNDEYNIDETNHQFQTYRTAVFEKFQSTNPLAIQCTLKGPIRPHLYYLYIN
jgi:hypothetical protein